jgi:hypothetical protein
MQDDIPSFDSTNRYQDFLKTSDFNLAATLYTLGFSIDGIDKSNRKRVVFYFKRTSDIEVNVKNYFNNKVLINPLALYRCEREIQAIIHTEYE